MKKKVIFVHNEQSGLGQSNQVNSSEWEAAFVSSGWTAMAALEDSSFNAIVCELEMPRISGISLLTEVKSKFPEIIRVLLDNNDFPDKAVKEPQAFDVAHQFLPKLSSNEIIFETLSRCYQVQSQLEDKTLKKMIGKLQPLPPVPTLYAEVEEVLSETYTSLSKVLKVIERNSALSLKILQIVNSPFLGLNRQIPNIQEALTILGLQRFKSLILAVDFFRGLKRFYRKDGITPESLQKHSLVTARIAATLLPNSPEQAAHAWTAALLHDVGKLVLEAQVPGQYDRVIKLAQTENQPLYIVEKEILGVTHAEIGGILLESWGLPQSVIEAVTLHHTPAPVEKPQLDIVGAVFVANKLSKQFDPSDKSWSEFLT